MSDDTQALELWQAEWDKLGDGIHAYTRARQSGVNAIASLQARLAVAEGALEAIIDNYPTDMSHVDYRVRACREATDALAAILT